jgi:hypothetical protein
MLLGTSDSADEALAECCSTEQAVTISPSASIGHDDVGEGLAEGRHAGWRSRTAGRRLLQQSGRSYCFAAGAATPPVLTPLLVLGEPGAAGSLLESGHRASDDMAVHTHALGVWCFSRRPDRPSRSPRFREPNSSRRSAGGAQNGSHGLGFLTHSHALPEGAFDTGLLEHRARRVLVRDSCFA